MPRRPRTVKADPSPDLPDVSFTPERKRKADALLRGMAALDNAGDHPRARATREELRAKAAMMGMAIVSITITHEAMPDPVFAALPRAERDRIDAVSRAMYTNPAGQIAALERLVARHPGIPMLRNHLGGAYEAVGQRGRALATIAQAAREFPTYVFAFCNHVLMLLAGGEVAKARAIVEEGPRGPLFHPSFFDPARDTYHVSEAASYASMVGHYMVATHRREAAKVQLTLLRKIAPGSPQTRRLEEALHPVDHMQDIADLIRYAAARLAQRGKKNAGRQAKAKAQQSPPDGNPPATVAQPAKRQRRGESVRIKPPTPARTGSPRTHQAVARQGTNPKPPPPEGGLFEG